MSQNIVKQYDISGWDGTVNGGDGYHCLSVPKFNPCPSGMSGPGRELLSVNFLIDFEVDRYHHYEVCNADPSGQTGSIDGSFCVAEDASIQVFNAPTGIGCCDIIGLEDYSVKNHVAWLFFQSGECTPTTGFCQIDPSDEPGAMMLVEYLNASIPEVDSFYYHIPAGTECIDTDPNVNKNYYEVTHLERIEENDFINSQFTYQGSGDCTHVPLLYSQVGMYNGRILCENDDQGDVNISIQGREDVFSGIRLVTAYTYVWTSGC